MEKSTMEKIARKEIMRAVFFSSLAEIQEILKVFSLVSDETYFDYEVLKAALKRRDPKIADFLMFYGCRVWNPNRANVREETPLHLAAELDNVMIVKKILDRGASIYHKNFSGFVPIYLAFRQGYVNVCKEILRYCSYLTNLNPGNVDDVLHFHIACVINDVSAVKVYLASGFNPNSALTVSLEVGEHMQFNKGVLLKSVWIYSGQTPLQFAASYKYEEMVQLFLDVGADINVLDTKGRTALHYSISSYSTAYDVEQPKRNITIKLLNNNPRVDLVDNTGRSALHEAFSLRRNEKVEKNKKSLFEMILSNLQLGSTNVTDKQGLSYLHMMCTSNDVNRVKMLIKAGADINSCITHGKYDGYTPLHFAVLYNQRKVVDFLLKSNANVNLQIADSKETPLHLACGYNYMKFHDLISKFDWAKQSDESTNLDWKLNCRNQMGIIRLLLSHGANTEIEDSSGITALMHIGTIDYFTKHFLLDWLEVCSVSHDKLNIRLGKMIGMLVKNGANVGHLSNSKQTILHILSQYKFPTVSERLVKFLVTKGAGIDLVDNKGLTALHLALKIDNKEMVKALLINKADANAKYIRHTMLALSIQRIVDSKEDSDIKNDILCLLLEHGSDVNALTADGRTPLNYAISEKNIFVVAKLLQYGADINLTNASGNFSVHSLVKAKDTQKNIQFFQLFKIIFIHVQKLRALGLNVCESVLNCCNDLYPQYKKALAENVDNLIELDRVYDDCEKELDTMKLIKIDDGTFLYDILVKDSIEVAKHMNNSCIIQLKDDENLEKHFPLYGYLLKLQFKRGLTSS